MNSKDLKRIVKEKYGAIAEQKEGQYQTSCCGDSSGCCSSVDYTVFSENYEKLRKDAEMYVGCVSGAIDLDEYLGLIKQNGFRNILMHKQKEISLPDELFKKYLTCDESELFSHGKVGIYSITVSGFKQ